MGLSMSSLNSMLDLAGLVCFARLDAKRSTQAVGPGGSRGVGSNRGAVDRTGRTGAVGSGGQSTSLSQECPSGGRTVALRGGASRSMAGAARLVGGGLPYSGARPVDWLA